MRTHFGAARMCAGARATNSLEFPERTRRCPEGSTGVRCDRWRIFASLLRLKDAGIAAFRELFGPKSVVESPPGPGRSGRTFAPRAERNRFGAHHPHQSSAELVVQHYRRRLPPSPARLPSPPAIRGDGFLRSHGPTEDIVNHQMVNARLTLLRVTAAEADEKFGGISGADEALPERLDRYPMRQVAHFCVTLRHSRDRKDAEIAAFRALFGRKSAVESPKWRKSLPAPILTPSLQMLQECSIVAHECPIARRPKIRPGG
jgi:hypothetical protein